MKLKKCFINIFKKNSLNTDNSINKHNSSEKSESKIQGNLKVSLKKGKEFIDLNQFDEAENMLNEIIKNWPNSIQPFIYLGLIAYLKEDWKEYLENSERATLKFSDNSTILIQKSRALIELEQFKEAELIIQQSMKRWPDNMQFFHLQALLANRMDKLQTASKIYQEISVRLPEDEISKRNYFLSLIEINKIEKAYELCKKEIVKSNNKIFKILMARIYIRWYKWEDAASLLRTIPGYDEEYIRVRILEAFILRKGLYSNGLEEPTEILETLYTNFSENIQVKIELAIIYIHSNRKTDAGKIIVELYKKYNYHSGVLILYSWYKDSINDYSKAEQIWNMLIEKRLIKRPTLNMYGGTLERIDKNFFTDKPDQILLFTCIKNEHHQLPWFLKYYRELGVDQFFFVDNGSNDGGTEFLKKQKDVCLFWTEYNYGKARSGMQWINKLIDIHGKKHWCIYLDVDEALIYPGIEGKNLKFLVKYMKKKGHEAFRTFMLDMYPKNTNRLSNKNVGDPIVNSPYFDKNYQFFGSQICPYSVVRGGIRNRLFGERGNRTKTPLIDGGKKIKFLSSSHQTTPAIVSDVTGILLHFKLIADLGERGLSEFRQKDRRYYCNQRHLNYANVLAKLGENYNFINPLTEKYKSSSQLVKLNYMSQPVDFK